ncbi:MAG: trehalose-phosphatase [Gemmatimonadaceae bacterium]
MRSLWGSAGMHELRAACSGEPLLVGFDFDGTLAPGSRDRRATRMRRLTSSRLLRLARVVPCAVVSGRTLADLSPRVRGIPWAAVIGSHGIEPFFRSQPFAVRARSWHTLVGAELAAIAEVDVERKPYGMTVHYRGARDQERARRDIGVVLARLEGARVMWGSTVADVTPLGTGKNHGFERVRRKSRAQHVIYVGDDANDEDVFHFGKSRDWITVRVGRSKTSQARFFIHRQRDIDRLLLLLHELHANPTTRRDRTARRYK